MQRLKHFFIHRDKITNFNFIFNIINHYTSAKQYDKYFEPFNQLKIVRYLTIAFILYQ